MQATTTRPMVSPNGSAERGNCAHPGAFVFSVAKELHQLAIPRAVAATAAHWSLIRNEKHHVSDVLAGGAIGLAWHTSCGRRGHQRRPPWRGGNKGRPVKPRTVPDARFPC